MEPQSELTWNQLLAFVENRSKGEFKTRRGYGFKVEKNRDAILFTPQSTGFARPETRRTGEKFLEEFNRTGITKTSHYQQISVNSSYLLSLIDALSHA